MLGDRAGKKLEKYVPDYVVFDLEATGVNTISDKIIEIGAIKVIGGEAVDEFSTLVDPQMDLLERITEITGIKNEDLSGAPVIEECLFLFDDFIGELPLVGHNINRFDMKMIYKEATRICSKTFTNDYIDTLPYARHLLPALQHHGLGAMCEYYGIDSAGAHRALNDAYMNYRVYERLKQEPPSGRESRICPLCGEILYKRSGKHGLFYSCSTYPTCKYIEKI